MGVWANPNDPNAPPMPPGLLSPVQMGDPGLDLHAGLAKIFPAPAPMVGLDPNNANQTQGAFDNGNTSEAMRLNAPETMRLHDQGKLAKDFQKDADPYGSPDNHPGILGKLGHALSHATGGDTRRGWEEQGLAKQINSQIADDSQNASRDAATAHMQAETPEVAPNAESTRKLQGANVENLESETQLRNNPNESWKAIPSLVGPNGEPVEIEDKSGQVRFGSVQGAQQLKQPKPDTPEQQYIDEFQKSHPGGTIAQAVRAYTDSTQRPPQMMMMVPGENGSSTAQLIHPGSTIAPGAQTGTQLGSMSTPTSQQRTSAGRADVVLSSIPDVIQDLNQHGSQLGPGMGRFNDIYSGKIGAPNPEFAGLVADLKLMGTAVALAHAQGRMSNELLNEFNSMIAAPQQSPENIKAVLGKVQNYMTKQSELGHGKPLTRSEGAPQEGATKTNGAGIPIVFKGGKWQAQ